MGVYKRDGIKRIMKSKKSPYKQEFLLHLLFLLKKGLTASQIAIKLNKSKQLISYHMAKLKRNGIIKYLGSGVWVVKETPYKDGTQHLSKILTSPKEIRGHGFVFRLMIPKHIKKWERRVEYLKREKINYRLQGIKANTPRVIIDKHKIWLGNKNLTVFFPKGKSYYSTQAKTSKNSAIFDFLNLVGKIERALKISLKTNGKYFFGVSKQHYALIKNELANIYNNPRRNLEIYDGGKLWFLIDNSFNLDEAETVDPVVADLDMDNAIKPFFNSLRKNPFTAEDIKIIREEQIEVINRLKEISSNMINTTIALEQIQSNVNRIAKKGCD